MNVGWHWLPGNADDAAPLPAATFLDLDPALGMRSPERLCRVYFKGRPQPQEIAQKANGWHSQGCRVQIGNEPNLPMEEFGGGPDDYAAWFSEIQERAILARSYWAGMSPGVPGWQAWYEGAWAADGIAAHAYGTFDEMRAVVDFLVPLGRPIWLAEVNFGAGQQVDRDAWARDHFRPFLDYCATVPLVEAVTYFAYRWQTPDMHLPTPVDGAGTKIERVLREWTPAVIKRPSEPQEPTMPDYTTVSIGGCDVLDVRDRSPYVNGEYDERDGDAISTFVQHHSVTALPVGQDAALAVLDAIQRWHTGTPPNGNGWPAIGYHFAIDGAGRVYWLNGLNLVSYHARVANTYGVGVVWLGTFTNEAPPAVMVDASRRLYRGLVKHLGRNLALVGHYEVKTNETSCPGKGHWARTKQAILRQEPAPGAKPPDRAAYEGMAWSRLNDAGQWLIARGDAQDRADGETVIRLMDASKKRHGA